MIDSIHQQIEEINANPVYGSKLTIFSLVVGTTFNLVKGGHINPLIMDFLQCGAWGTGILVGVLTAIGYIKKFREKPKPHG